MINSKPSTVYLERPSDAADVLFVDLDGSLVSTDLFWESMLHSIRVRPRRIITYLTHAWRGRAALKNVVAKAAMKHISPIPYREDVLEIIRAQKDRGQHIVLATAADHICATAVAKDLGLFDDVLASNGRRNLKGHCKLKAIEDYCQKHGFTRFAYLGDAKADLAIWKNASEVYVVEPTASLLQSIGAASERIRVVGTVRSRLRALVTALRPHQWVKNLLLFVPLILSRELVSITKTTHAVLAFVAFGACASSVYLINDLVDIQHDRRHPVKKHRPFASGTLPLFWGPPLAAASSLFGILLATAFLPWKFSVALCVYLLSTTAYSFWLKRIVLVDVLVLAGLYTLRILSGGIAVDVQVTEWLMAFSVFLFLSLAFAKRYAELLRVADSGRSTPDGRGYFVNDVSVIENMGITSGYVAVLVLSLYINSDAVTKSYQHVWTLWFFCPLLLYWISRVWLLAKRQQLTEDPVVFAITDRPSLLIACLSAALLLVAILPW